MKVRLKMVSCTVAAILLFSSSGYAEQSYPVTEVYSVNNSIDECYYKPKLEEVKGLEQYVLSQGFVNAYTGYFDLNESKEYCGGIVPSRELEILGYDMLVNRESFTNGQYSVSVADTNNILYSTAVMNIYKALGIELYDYVLSYDSNSDMNESPAVLGLPGEEIDDSRGRTNLFVTRSNPDRYKEKAVSELKLQYGSFGTSNVITSGDFIVLVKDMMHFYGEPVLSQLEQNKLLQTYGANIPTYLTPNEQEAYVYLRAKGVLNDETIDYSKPLTMTQMLEILACVKDEDSRSNFKEIQLTMEYDADLVERGYFPKTVEIVDGSSAIQISREVDYINADYFDYYVKLDDNTRFVTSGGAEVDCIFVPSIPADPSSPPLDGVVYKGISRDADGNEYYHLTIEISATSDYIKETGGLIQLNTRSSSDYPYYIWIEEGGGIYEYDSMESFGGVITRQTGLSTGDDLFETSVTQERVDADAEGYRASEDVQEVVDVLSKAITGNFVNDNLQRASILTKSIVKNTVDNVCLFTADILLGKPLVVEADTVLTERVTLYNASNIDVDEIRVRGYTVDENTNFQDSITVTVPHGKVSYFLSTIKRDTSKTQRTVFDGLATLSGDLMVKFSDLSDKGLVFALSSDLPLPDSNNILELETKYGRVILDQDKHRIVTGNSVFDISDENILLYKYVYENDKTELYIDFRAVYGWTANIVDIVVTGDSQASTVNIVTRDSSMVEEPITQMTLAKPKDFTSITQTNKVGVLEAELLGESGEGYMLMSQNYPLANYVVYYGATNGVEEDYVIVYYPRTTGVDGSSSASKISNLMNVVVSNDNWVSKIFPLSRVTTSVPGQFSYTERFGYVYNLPSKDEFTMDKYISGELILPIYRDDTVLRDVNVNAYENVPYGSRPFVNGDGTISLIDVKGITTGVVDNQRSNLTIYPAPVGVTMFFGGTSGTISLSEAERVGIVSKSSVIYLGAQPATLFGTSGNDVYLDISINGSYPFSRISRIDSSSNIYRINVAPDVNGNVKAIYAYIGEVLTEEGDNVVFEYNSSEDEYTVISTDRVDEKLNIRRYSMEKLISDIDNNSTIVIIFVFSIAPYLMIVLLTVLLGLAVMAESRLFRDICSKTIDPVKILTLGRRTVENINVRNSIASIIAGYVVSAFLLDGNMFRLIEYLATWVGVLMELVKSM